MTDVDSEVRIPRMEPEEEDAASGGYESASGGGGDMMDSRCDNGFEDEELMAWLTRLMESSRSRQVGTNAANFAAAIVGDGFDSFQMLAELTADDAHRLGITGGTAKTVLCLIREALDLEHYSPEHRPHWRRWSRGAGLMMMILLMA